MDGFDAIVLAGGTSRRLGGVAKHSLEVEGSTLLERTLQAVSGAGRVVVVGDESLKPLVGRGTVIREDPPLAGPAAGIGAGLPLIAAERVIVFACDHPFLADAVEPLLRERGADGNIAVDADGRRQNLMFSVRTEALRGAVGRQVTLTDLAVHTLLSTLNLTEIAVPPHTLRDVDTWQDLEHDH